MMIREFSDYLKGIEQTIYGLAVAKKIPAFKVAGCRRFSRADINRWISTQSDNPGSKAD